MTIPPLSEDAEQLLPPESLRVRVGASRDSEVFRKMGKSIAGTVSRLAGNLDGKRVLDFGCGCARVLRYLAPAYPKAEWHGVDVDSEAIAWCQGHIPDRINWESCSEFPPLSYQNTTFDLIYQISVFTHLSESMQIFWLKDLSRVLKADGLLIISVYNEMIHEILPKALRKQLDSAGILYGNDGGTQGLPASYQSCFHTQKYIQNTWSQWFIIEDVIERAFFHSLDAILLRKHPEPSGLSH